MCKYVHYGFIYNSTVHPLCAGEHVLPAGPQLLTVRASMFQVPSLHRTLSMLRPLLKRIFPLFAFVALNLDSHLLWEVP